MVNGDNIIAYCGVDKSTESIISMLATGIAPNCTSMKKEEELATQSNGGIK
jgi:hypothetical protein